MLQLLLQLLPSPTISYSGFEYTRYHFVQNRLRFVTFCHNNVLPRSSFFQEQENEYFLQC